MKKIEITILVILTLLMSCQNQKQERKFPEVKNLSEYEETEFLPTLEHSINTQKNSVYCATLLFAWDEIRKQINLPLIISEEDKDLLLLNNSTSFINVLKSDEYFASGTIDGNLITARAEFNKSLPFEEELDSYNNKLIFKGQAVVSFGVRGYNGYGQVRIGYYKNDNNFIIKLLPKDKNHEIVLFKSDNVFHSMAEMNEEIRKLLEIGQNERKNEKHEWKYYIADEDEVIIPKFSFNIKTNFSTLEGNEFRTAEQDYLIGTAWQRTAFLLDESGAEIESEAEFEVYVEEELEEEEKEKPQPKKMIFDNDFLILLKRTDAQHPYFGLWTTNTELMIKE